MRPLDIAALHSSARFGVALLAVALAFLIRFAASPLIGNRFQFLTFFPAILVSAWFGGFWPGAFATLLSAVLVSLFWIEPAGVLRFTDPTDLGALIVFTGAGLAISAVHESLRRERAALMAARVAAELAAGSAERAGREADLANRAKDEFLSILSHELRTPLTAILGWTSFLRTSSVDAATTARAFAAIERNSIAQARLIDDLFDISSIVAGKLRLDRRQTDLAAVIRAAVEQIQPAIEAKGLSVVTTIATDPGLIRADPDRLQQVAWNLLSNAVKFTPPAGKIEVTLDRTPSRLDLRVADTGEGISPDFLPHVFDRFRQADPSSTRAHHGLGLGLSLVKHLVEMHGGTVKAESAGPGQGATFTVSLPVPPPTASTDEALIATEREAIQLASDRS
jgi:signal transduction histidine kinase